MESLHRLQSWYRTQCDGEWEHSYGVRIGTLDNPGWTLKVDLAETPLAKKRFPEVKLNYEHPIKWLIGRVVDECFRAESGPEKLDEIIGIFLDWAEKAETN